jgi:hypothetical protein
MKRRTVLVFLLAAGAFRFLPGAALTEVGVDFAVKAPQEPVLDGRLDDPVWRTAVPRTRFYEYFKPRPDVSALRSEMRLLYTERALWIGLTHVEPSPEKLVVQGLVRDSVSWTEDMSEIYIDPAGAAIGYVKLLVNSRGVIGDTRRIDASVSEPEWSGLSWRARAQVAADRWTLEICVPYGDLNQTPEPGGALWRLCVTRFQWTTGAFVGTVSSPGGNYKNPAGFGYVYFLPSGQAPAPDVLQRALAGKVAAPWCTEIDGRLLHDFGTGVRLSPLADVVAEKRRETAAFFDGLSLPAGHPLSDGYAALCARWDAARRQAVSLQAYRAADDVLAAARVFSWKVRLEDEFGGAK